MNSVRYAPFLLRPKAQKKRLSEKKTSFFVDYAPTPRSLFEKKRDKTSSALRASLFFCQKDNQRVFFIFHLLGENSLKESVESIADGATLIAQRY